MVTWYLQEWGNRVQQLNQITAADFAGKREIRIRIECARIPAAGRGPSWG